MPENVELIADGVVELVNGIETDWKFEAYKPEKAQLEVEDPGIVVQVIPVAGGARQKVGRRAIRRIHSVNLYVTAQLDSSRSREAMVKLVDELLSGIELTPIRGCTWSEIEEISLYDRDAHKKANRFASLHRSNYVEEYTK
ncbi:MAG: hypothetical protein AAGF31_03320 [Planctomycetota bacterium]